MASDETARAVASGFDVLDHPGYRAMVRQVVRADRSRADHPRYDLLVGLVTVALVVYMETLYRAAVAVKSRL